MDSSASSFKGVVEPIAKEVLLYPAPVFDSVEKSALQQTPSNADKSKGRPSLMQARSSPDVSADRKRVGPLTASQMGSFSLNSMPTTASSSPGFKPTATPGSMPNTPDPTIDKKKTPTARFLTKEKLFPSSPSQGSRKRGGSFLMTPPANATPPIKPMRKPITVTTTPPLDGDFDYDFTKSSGSSPELTGRKGAELGSGAARGGIGPNTPSPKMATVVAARRAAAANPLIADKASQWGQSERLEDWVAMINNSAEPMSRPGTGLLAIEPAALVSKPTSTPARTDGSTGESSNESSDLDGSSDYSDSEGSDLDSSGDSEQSSDSSSSSSDNESQVTELESKDSRTRFLEEEDEVFSSSDSLNGSRVSRSLPPLAADAVRRRAVKELEVLASLVPARVLYAHALGLRPHGGHLRAMREEFDGAVLFADISGFTRLAELLVRRQNPNNAAESLTKYVGWNLHEMVEVICSFGGDVMKFAGDAILAVFAADQFGGSLSKAAVCCAQAALSLQGLELSAGDARLSVHSGMGVGRVATYEVGGLQDRWEVFVAGPPVEQIGRCEPQAKAGELVVSTEARQCIEKMVRIRGAMVEHGNFRLDKILDRVQFDGTPVLAKDLAQVVAEDADRAIELKRTLQKYLSRPVIFSIEGHGQTLWGAELRVCSTLFVKFKGLSFMEPSEEDLALVQHVVRNIVQKVMAELEGTVCRFMVDDKGAAMLLAFGLIPFCHPNDSARAVRAALRIRDGVAALSLTKPPAAEQQKRLHPTRKSAEELPPTAPSMTDATSTKRRGVASNNGDDAFPMPESFSRVNSASAQDQLSSSSPGGKALARRGRWGSKYRLLAQQQQGENVVLTVLTQDTIPTPKMPVSCQIGITRGKVCVGMVGGSTRCEYTLHGVLVNRAARLMGSATDGVIQCDQDTYLEARNEVEFDPNPVTMKLKGERKECKVYLPVRRAQMSQRRATGRSGGAESPQEGGSKEDKGDDEDDGFIGRAKERAETEAMFKKLNAEDPWCGAVGIQGDSGIGKTRMLQYVARRAKKHKITVLWGFAMDTEESTPFFAWKSIVIQLVGLAAINRAAALVSTPNHHVLQSVSSKETMTSHGSSHSFGSGVFAPPLSPKMRKNRSGSSRAGVSSPPPTTVNNTPPTPAPSMAVQQQPKRFDEMSAEEKKECLLEAMPLDKRELYPLLAPMVDEIISSNLLAENDTTTTVARNQRVSVAIETVTAMISYLATRLQQRGERLCIIMEDLQWMDAASLELLLQVSKTVPRHIIFCSGTYSEDNRLARMMPFSTVWTLHGLEKHELGRCIRQWLHVSKVSEEAVAMIYEKSNGNPLFSEELCRLMIDNHYLEIAANDSCVLTNVGASGETRVNLPNSIIALFTASLDRLNAPQQIVLRVVSVMGMQFTLHDLAGVLKVINSSNYDKVFGGGAGEESKQRFKFDVSEPHEMTLEQMLKEGTNTKGGLKAPAGQKPSQQQSNTTPLKSPANGPSSAPSSAESNASTASLLPHSSSGGFSSNLGVQATPTNQAQGQPSHGKAKSDSADSAGAAAGAQGDEDYTFKFVAVTAVLDQLVAKGILDERPGMGSKRAFVFRHAMMKEVACEELLREESKQKLHQIIGEYYEERPASDSAQWYATLAEHFFASGDKAKARKYLELAGEGAVQNHATQQIFLCYSRLMKLSADEVELAPLTRAQWSRRVGEALFHMDRYLQAEEHLHKALEILQLDCRDAPAMSGTEAGFFPKASKGFFGLFSSRAGDQELQVSPSPRRRSLWGSCFGSSGRGDDDDEYAEEFERFIVKSDSDVIVPTDGTSSSSKNLLLIPSPAPSTLSAATVTMLATHGGSTTTINSTNGADLVDKRPSTLRQSNGGGSNSTKLRTRHRTMSMVEQQSPLRPRLLIALDSFNRLKATVRSRGSSVSSESRNDALNVLLEAAVVYDLLGRMLRDRSSSVALERRLNAIILAEAAATSLSGEQQQSPAAMAVAASRRAGRGGGTSPSSLKSRGLGQKFVQLFSPRSGNKSGSGQSEQQQQGFWVSQASQAGTSRETEQTLSQLYNATLGGANALNNTNAPTISPAQQRILDELSRAYSRAAVFFAGMHPGTRWRGLAKPYSLKAKSFLQNHGSVSKADLVQHSENLVLLQQRCGEYEAMQGNFVEACEKLRFAVWGARFMHLDRARVDSKVLEVAVFFFNGDLDSCNTTACEFFERNSAPKIVALGARFMALCGAYDLAIHKLRGLAKLNGPAPVEEDLASLDRGLDALGDANAWLALSLAAWRKDGNGKVAIKAARMAAEQVLCMELSDNPLHAFHAVALCFTAFWDPLRDTQDVALIESGRDLHSLELLLKRLLGIIRSFAVVYKVCRPHALYCVAIRPLILARAAQSVALVQQQSLGAPVVMSAPSDGSMSELSHDKTQSSDTLKGLAVQQQPNNIMRLTTPGDDIDTVQQEEDDLPEASSMCASWFRRPEPPLDPFVECALMATTGMFYWVEGLARLEMDDPDSWLYARELFMQYTSADYEVLRCERLLASVGIMIPEDGGEPQIAGDINL